MVFKAVSPNTGKIQFFVDKVLPFGARISCSHFQSFSSAICQIFEVKLGHPHSPTNYLDDFLIVAELVRQCNFMTDYFLAACKSLGVPIAMEKMEWTTDVITFLGLLLNGCNFMVSIQEEKRVKAVNELNLLLSKKKVTVKQLQQLAGLLNFLTKAIYHGRAFTRRWEVL